MNAKYDRLMNDLLLSNSDIYRVDEVLARTFNMVSCSASFQISIPIIVLF